MSYGLAVVVSPTEEPVSLEEMKRHLRVEHTAEDDDIRLWIKAARRFSEGYTNRRWVTQTLSLDLAGFSREIRLPVSPVQSIVAVRYYDAAGMLTALAAEDYQTWLGYLPPRISPVSDGDWPSVETGRLQAVTVEFVAGYGLAADVPEEAKAAIKLAVAYWYANRGDGKDPNGNAESLGIPPAAKRLLNLLDAGSY